MLLKRITQKVISIARWLTYTKSSTPSTLAGPQLVSIVVQWGSKRIVMQWGTRDIASCDLDSLAKRLNKWESSLWLMYAGNLEGLKHYAPMVGSMLKQSVKLGYSTLCTLTLKGSQESKPLPHLATQWAATLRRTRLSTSPSMPSSIAGWYCEEDELPLKECLDRAEAEASRRGFTSWHQT